MKTRVLYLGDEKSIWRAPFNDGIGLVLASRERLQIAGELLTVDTRALSDAERKPIYFKGATSTAKTKHRVRVVYGSNNGEPGIRTGREVPMLLNFADDGTVEDIYPHLDGVKYVTIADALGLSGKL